MVSTIEARAANPNYRLAMAQALQDANAYMVNSGVAVTYELAGFFDADYAETDKSSQLGDLKDPSRPLGASVAPVRDALSADLVTMYSTTKAYCGLGFVNANRSTGFSVVACLSSMSHELGHNFGANHNWEVGNNEGDPPYMFGYRYTGVPRFRTQLSYDCSGGSCPRIPYHSTPRVTYQGIPIGTAEHHDVARRFNERRETVENFYPPSSAISLTLYSYTNFQGQVCYLSILPGRAVDVRSECPMTTVNSFEVSGYQDGQKVCLYDSSGDRHVCYAGGTASPKTFAVANLNESNVPPTFVRSEKGGVLDGTARYALYGENVVMLFAEYNFAKPICSFGVILGSQKFAEQPGCPADVGTKARSARIFQQREPDGELAGRKWCFYGNFLRSTLCFRGAYWGQFGVADFDSADGIPAGITRTLSGNGINGGLYLFTSESVSVP